MIGRKYIDPTAIERSEDRRALAAFEPPLDEPDPEGHTALLAMQRVALDRLLQRIPPLLEETMRWDMLTLNEDGQRLTQGEIAKLMGCTQPTIHYRLKAGAVALQRVHGLGCDYTPTEVEAYALKRSGSRATARGVAIYWRWHSAQAPRRVCGPTMPAQSSLWEVLFGTRRSFTHRFPRDPVSIALMKIRGWGGFSGVKAPGFNNGPIKPT